MEPSSSGVRRASVAPTGRVKDMMQLFASGADEASRRRVLSQGSSPSLERRKSRRLSTRQSVAPYPGQRRASRASSSRSESTGLTDMLNGSTMNQQLSWEEEEEEAAPRLSRRRSSRQSEVQPPSNAAAAPVEEVEGAPPEPPPRLGRRTSSRAPPQVVEEVVASPMEEEEEEEEEEEAAAPEPPPRVSRRGSSRSGLPPTSGPPLAAVVPTFPPPPPKLTFPPPPADRRKQRVPDGPPQPPTVGELAMQFPQPPRSQPLMGASLQAAASYPAHGGKGPSAQGAGLTAVKFFASMKSRKHRRGR